MHRSWTNKFWCKLHMALKTTGQSLGVKLGSSTYGRGSLDPLDDGKTPFSLGDSWRIWTLPDRADRWQVSGHAEMGLSLQRILCGTSQEHSFPFPMVREVLWKLAGWFLLCRIKTGNSLSGLLDICPCCSPQPTKSQKWSEHLCTSGQQPHQGTWWQRQLWHAWLCAEPKGGVEKTSPSCPALRQHP